MRRLHTLLIAFIITLIIAPAFTVVSTAQETNGESESSRMKMAAARMRATNEDYWGALRIYRE
ncbi:MAG: hypothetical protein C0594_12485, partial [Marinilabiliales bacterium]